MSDVRIDIAKRCRLKPVDWILALSLGGVVCVAQLVLSVPGADPSQWQSLAVAAGLLPPREVIPGFWRSLVAWMFPLFGIGPSIRVLAVLGALVGGAIASYAYVVTRQILVLLVRILDDCPVWFDRIVPFFAAASALLLAVSSPVWRLAQTFCPDQLHFVLFLALIQLWLWWLASGGACKLYTMTVLLGLLSADTPFALAILPALFLVGYFMFWRRVKNGIVKLPERLPSPDAFPKWKIFFLFAGVLGLGAWLNGTAFSHLQGVTVNAWDASDLYFRYVMGYVRAFFGASTLAGWVLGLGIGLIPLVVALRTFPIVVTDERGMRFGAGVLLFFVAVLSAMQSGAIPGARFWALNRETVLISSGLLLALYVFCSVLAIALSVSAFAFAVQQLHLSEKRRRPDKRLQRLVPALVVCMVALALIHVPRPVETAMMRLVRDAIEETLDECGEAKWLFTDGHLDDALRLAAASRGSALKPLSLMSGPSAWEKAVRERNFPEDSIDRTNAAIGIPMLLRVWACEKPHGLDEAAMQLGFELWKRERRALPKMSGLVGREEGLTDEAAAQGIEHAKALAARVLELAPKIDASRPSPALAHAFSAVSWRLSRFARARGEQDLADRLDASNSVLQQMLSLIEYERQRTFMQLTPREGLMIALRRADFVEAQRYAAAVLRSDGDDLDANFGMGMGCLKDGKLEDAERYLRRCLKTRPDEPAVLNNLAIICRKTNRAEEAVELAQHALKMLPDSAEVKKTLADAEEDVRRLKGADASE